MRIILVTYDFHPPIGGQGVEAIGLHQALKEEGVIPIVINPKSYGMIADGSLKSQIKYNILTNAYIGSFSKSSDSCVIQIYGGPGGVILLRKPHIKTKTIILANHTYAQQRKWRKGIIRSLLYRVAVLLEKRAYRNADAIISISSDTKKSLQKYYRIESSKISVIPVGIDFPRINQKKGTDSENSILFVGRLHWRKDPLTLIKAFQIVRGKMEKASLQIVGTGPLDTSLKKYVSSNSVKDVKFWGKVSQNQLMQLYNTATVMAIPSQFEGLGIVGIEAMSHGLPVVASNALGIREVVIDNVTGFLFETGNHLALAQKLITILADNSMRTRMSNAAARIAGETYDWRIIVKRFLEVYERLNHVPHLHG